jgi:hypothetical protein
MPGDDPPSGKKIVHFVVDYQEFSRVLPSAR